MNRFRSGADQTKTFNSDGHTSKHVQGTTMNDLRVFAAICVCAAATAAVAGHQPQVRILKQLNRQNEDGSYSYGYESADGTYRVETRSPSGEVRGKYGYVDETGRLRSVEYGASSARGFEPAGTGITVPPPDAAGEPQRHGGGAQPEDESTAYDDGQYREDPGAYYGSQPAAVPRNPAARSESSRQRAAHQHHPSVSNFDPASGSFSVSYST